MAGMRYLSVFLALIAFIQIGGLVATMASRREVTALRQEAVMLRQAIPPPPDLSRFDKALAKVEAYQPPDLGPAMKRLEAMSIQVDGAVGAVRRIEATGTKVDDALRRLDAMSTKVDGAIAGVRRMEDNAAVLRQELERAYQEARQVVIDADSHIRLIEDILMTTECIDFDAAFFTPFGIGYLGPVQICGQNLTVKGAQ